MHQRFPGVYVFNRSMIELLYEKELIELMTERCYITAVLKELQFASGAESAAALVVPPSEINAITILFTRGNTLRHGWSWMLFDTPENLKDASRITDPRDWK